MKNKNRILIVIIVIALMFTSVFVTATVMNKNQAALESGYSYQLENAQAEAAALQTQLQHTEEEWQNNREILTGLITRVDYKDEPVYVIGHKAPDSDTVGSAIGMAYLLNSLGISAEARITAKLNLETEYAFSEFGLPAPEILEDASGKQLWLVDHSASTQMVNGAEKARIVGITDHHGMGNAENTEPICVLSFPAGSACSIVYKLSEICGVELPKDIASALLTGLLSDTSNLKSSNVSQLDEDAMKKLKTLSGISDTDGLFNGMKESKLSFKGMDDREIFYSDYKNYEYNGTKYGIGCVEVARPDQLPAMAERMQRVLKTEMENGCEPDFLLYSIYDTNNSTGYIGYIGKDAEFIDTLIENVFGGKAEQDGEYLLFKPSLIRKKDIVPPINHYLDTLK